MPESKVGCVVLIGRDSDLHLDAVLHQLHSHEIRTFRFDPERLDLLDTTLSATWSNGTVSAEIDTYAGLLAVSEVRGVFCRYAIENLEIAPGNALDRFKGAEFWAAVRGVLLQVPATRWINDPFAEARADHKAWQLSLAQQVGLRIPATLVSQSRDQIIRFIDEHGPCVVKPLSDTGLVRTRRGFDNHLPAEIGEGESLLCSFASRLDVSTLYSAQVDLRCPVFVQAEVKKQSDLRVTVVDNNVFAAELRQGDESDISLDVRNAEATTVAPFALDDPTKLGITKLVSRLGLRYASCDFALQNERPYFLEANVSGNWLWTEALAGLSVSAALADSLMGA